MKREEIKNILFEMGASARLLEMPAVMERIYNYYINYSEQELRKTINIGQNGEIECKINDEHDDIIRKFSEAKNGEAIYENNEIDGIEQSGTYLIDKYGMDRFFKDDANPLFEKECSVLRNTDRTIEVNGSRSLEEDQGDPILNYNNYTVLKENFSRTIGWEANKDFLTKYYPITKEWFAVREGILEKNEEENESIKIEDVEYRNAQLEARNSELEKQNANLSKSNEILESRLENTRKIVINLKNFIVKKCGKIPFLGRSIIKQMNEELFINQIEEPKEKIDR